MNIIKGLEGMSSSYCDGQPSLISYKCSRVRWLSSDNNHGACKLAQSNTQIFKKKKKLVEKTGRMSSNARIRNFTSKALFELVMLKALLMNCCMT